MKGEDRMPRLLQVRKGGAEGRGGRELTKDAGLLPLRGPSAGAPWVKHVLRELSRPGSKLA